MIGRKKAPISSPQWGISTRGFANRLECPELMFRETEVFSAYYAKLLRRLLDTGYDISRLVVCLSGQHEMTEDFSGFRNFFTLNFIAKPIYNAHLLASWIQTDPQGEKYRDLDWSLEYDLTRNGDPDDTQTML